MGVSFFAPSEIGKFSGGKSKYDSSAKDKDRGDTNGHAFACDTSDSKGMDGVGGVGEVDIIVLSVLVGGGIVSSEDNEILFGDRAVFRGNIAHCSDTYSIYRGWDIQAAEGAAHIKGAVPERADIFPEGYVLKACTPRKAEVAHRDDAVGNGHSRKGSAGSKAGLGQSRNAVGKLDRAKGRAAAEAAHSYLLHGGGDNDALQRKAGIEGVVSDFFDVFGDRDVPQRAAFVKGVVAYLRDLTALDSLGYFDIHRLAAEACYGSLVVDNGVYVGRLVGTFGYISRNTAQQSPYGGGYKYNYFFQKNVSSFNNLN